MNMICENKIMYRVHCLQNTLTTGITVSVFPLESREDHFIFLCLDLHTHIEAGGKLKTCKKF